MISRTVSWRSCAGLVPLWILLAAPSVGAQAPDAPKPPAQQSPAVAESEPVVVTATRGASPAFDAPYSTDVITDERLRERAYRTVPQALRDTPGVMVQETGVGQGSPYIRGFTGYQTLFLIDGIRLNNSVFRSGPNQYWATVNPLSIDRLEVVKGPSSVLYGSDAIGGTVQAFTKDPWTGGAGWSAGGSVFARYGTADDSLWGRGELSASYGGDHGAETGVLIGGDRKFFHDVEGGHATGDMPYTGYDEGNLDGKLVHRFDVHTRLVLAHQTLKQFDSPRTHRTVWAKSFEGTDVGSELQHEFDQERRLSYLQLHSEGLDGFVDAMHFSASWQTQTEVRERLRTGNRRDFQGFDVDTLGLWLQLESETSLGRLAYGAEWYHDDVGSFSSANAIQGPVADDATYDTAAVYVQDTINVDDRFDVIVGGRFNYAAADAGRVADPTSGNPISIDDDWSDAVFSLRGRYELVREQLAVYGGASQGFRAPNLSDLTRFDVARSDEIEVPSPGLDSERYLTYELGLHGSVDGTRGELAVFYTQIDDMISRYPTGAVTADGDRVVQKANVGDGYVWGIEFAGSQRLFAGTSLFGNLTYLEGEVDAYTTSQTTTSREYLTRLMPLTAMAGLRWEEPELQRVWLETLVRWADDADRLSFSDTQDTQRVPPGGTPGYTTWDVGAGWRLHDDASFFARLENIADVDYRIHGSGTNMPGRNFVFAIESRF